jgi:hypothetical protein
MRTFSPVEAMRICNLSAELFQNTKGLGFLLEPTHQ